MLLLSAVECRHAATLHTWSQRSLVSGGRHLSAAILLSTPATPAASPWTPRGSCFELGLRSKALCTFIGCIVENVSQHTFVGCGHVVMRPGARGSCSCVKAKMPRHIVNGACDNWSLSCSWLSQPLNISAFEEVPFSVLLLLFLTPAV